MGSQFTDSFRQQLAVVARIYPEHFQVGFRKTDNLQPHESYVVHEGEIANHKSGKFMQPLEIQPMDHQADFNPLSAPSKVHDSPYRFIVGAFHLHNEIMLVRDV